MSGADVIGAAICITLLIVVAYAVVGSIMATAGVVSNAQNDMALSQQVRLETSILDEETHYHECIEYHCDWWGLDCTWWQDRVDFRVQNTGDQKITDLSHIDVMLIWGTGRPYLYKNGTGTLGTMTYYRVGIYKDNSDSPTPENFNIGMWDPGEYLYGWAQVDSPPDYISIVLPNGLKAARGNINLISPGC